MRGVQTPLFCGVVSHADGLGIPPQEDAQQFFALTACRCAQTASQVFAKCIAMTWALCHTAGTGTSTTPRCVAS